MIKQFLIWLGWWRLSRAKRRANNLHKMTGRRYYVINYEGKPLVVDRNFVNLYNREHPKQKITIERLLRMSLYYTK